MGGGPSTSAPVVVLVDSALVTLTLSLPSLCAQLALVVVVVVVVMMTSTTYSLAHLVAGALVVAGRACARPLAPNPCEMPGNLRPR